MSVYVDVLIFVNFVIDFLLLRITASVSARRVELVRLVLASIVASFFSLYIFLPTYGLWFELLIRVLSSLLPVLVAFGFRNLKVFLRAFFSFYAVSFIFAGAILGLKQLLPGSSVVVSNGVVYFDISPVVLIALSFIIYLVIFVVNKITARTAEQSSRYRVRIIFKEKSIECDAITDTGHTLKDTFGDSMVIIVDKATALQLFGTTDCECMFSFVPPDDEYIKTRFRLVPIKTVSGEKMLPAVRCDSIEVTQKGQIKSSEKYPVAVLSETSLGDDFSVILPII